MVCSSSNEARSVAAAQLREAVERLCEDVPAPGIYGEDSVKCNPAITNLNNKLQFLLRSGRKEYRLAAVSAVRFLFHGEVETMELRLRRAMNCFRVLFEYDVTDMSTARAATYLAADISLVNNSLCDCAMNHFITTVINNTAGLSNISSSPEGRSVSALVINELANHAPSFVFRERASIRPVLWSAVQDEYRMVREEAVKALQSVIENIFERAPVDAAEATRDVLSRMLDILQETTAPYSTARNRMVDVVSLDESQNAKVHGALLMFFSLIRSSKTSRGLMDHFSDFCKLVLPLQRCSDKNIREVVCRVLPRLAQLDKFAFVSKGFLENAHHTTMSIGRCTKFPDVDKGLSLEALGKIANEVGKDAFAPYLREVLLFCDSHLTLDTPNLVPQKYVIACLMYLANASHGSEEFLELMRSGLLKKVLQSEFTLVLVYAVCAIQSAFPALAESIELRLIQLIATILRQGVIAVLRRLSQLDSSTNSAAIGSDEEVGVSYTSAPTRSLVMPSRERENAEDAANVIDASFQQSKVVDYTPEFYPEKRNTRVFSNPEHGTTADGLYGVSYGSSVDNYSYGARESFLHSYVSSKVGAHIPSDRVLDLSLRLDKANSPCVALKAIEFYTITKMQVGDITLFTSQFVLEYLENDMVKVRLLAVRSCARLMDAAAHSWIEIQKARGQSGGLRTDIQKILLRLVTLAVADPSREVRRTALDVLDRDLFHRYLLQPHVLKNLFLCFYDECPKVRCLSVSLGGRLSRLNPAHVNISMRKLLEYLIEALRTEHHALLGMRRECTVLLQLFISEARPLVDCYSESIMEVLISRLNYARRVNDKGAAETVLHAIGDLGGISSRVNLFSYCNRIVPLVVSYILDDHASDRQFCKTAIHALLKLVQCTGYVIQPYSKFHRLLPGLLQLLSNENDAGLRLEIETLIGCLGAVDPVNHKDAALPSLAGSTLSQSQTSGARASRPSWTRTRTINPASLPESAECQSYPLVFENPVGSVRTRPLGPKGSAPVNPGFPASVQHPTQFISLFGVGPEKLIELTSSYAPVWALSECDEISLVGLLEHPFTASNDYFPSIALDKVMSIIRIANRKLQHREAFTALVRILGYCHDRIPNFLHAIFPCLLWVLRPEVSSETKPVMFSPFHEFVMARVAEIVTLAGKHILPYVFDTVLLVHRYIQDTRFHPKCVIAGCKLLVRIQIAIGDVFRPIISTLLSSLLEALSQDYGRSDSMAEAVLRVLESFGSMLNEYSAIVFQMIVNVLESAKNYSLKASALRTLISLLRDVDLSEVASVVLHPLIRILKYTKADEGNREQLIEEQKSSDQRGFDDLAEGAALAIVIVARKAPIAFKTFLPVVVKTLKSAPSLSSSEFGKKKLAKLLLEQDRLLTTQVLGLSNDRAQELLASSPGYADFSLRADSDTSSHSVNTNHQPPFVGAGPVEVAEIAIPEDDLMQLWRIKDNFTASDWTRWRSELEVGLIRFSGSAALRACSFLFESFPFLARPLFNAAFLSCWTPPSDEDGLSDSARREVVHILLRALQSPTMPINLTQAILNLFEYMEHDERPLPASVEFLAQTAFRCGAFAKALRYKEGEYAVIMRSNCSRAAQRSLAGNLGLLAIYEKLGHDESARGTAEHYKLETGSTLNEHIDQSDVHLDEYNTNFEQWAAKLGDWDVPDSHSQRREHKPEVSFSERMKALQVLREESVNSSRWSFLLKKLKTLNDLGRWRATNRLVKQVWHACEGNDAGRRKLAVDGKGISVAFDLANWEEFEERIHYLTEDPFLNAFYRTLLLVRRGREDPEILLEAEKYLAEARSHLDVHLTARLSEGYPRAYLEVINAQTLVELEEMIKYLRIPPSQKGFARYRLQAIWDQRLAGCKYDDYIWYRLLMIRALVLPPLESKDRWIEFSCLCRKNGRLPLASEALRVLVLPSLSPSEAQRLRNEPVESMSGQVLRNITDLDIRYAVCRHLWACDRQAEAFQMLKESVSEYKNAAYAWKSKEPVVCYLSSVEPEAPSNRKEVMVAAEVLLKLAKWSSRLPHPDSIDYGASQAMALEYAKSASEMRPNFDKPWHWWGLLNCQRAYHAMGMSMKEGSLQCHSVKQQVLNSEAREYLKSSIEGFFKSIKIGGRTKLEDSLRILTLWFKYGSVARMYEAFDRGFEDTVITSWLEVVPQIIARLHTSSRNVQAGIEHLLTRIGNEHPQMVVYNLIVAKNMQGHHSARREAASRVLDSIKRKHPGIVTQAEMVARELVRVAVLWGELWYEKLEEASRLYFGEKDLNSMLQCILPMHEMIDRGPETSYEKSFMELYGRELLEAGGIIDDLADAKEKNAPAAELDAKASKLWEYYYYVFGRIQKQQHMMNGLDLSKVSQWLKHASNLELAVPGTYNPNGKQTVTLQSFGSMLRILQSKQRPRKLAVLGSDGHQYDFLLKGHEDLRQDERVMQVFGLINQILSHSQERSIRRGVDIKRYAVIALSSNAGLIEWVPHCDTMHALVKEHREVRKVMPNIEHKVMTRVAPEPERLSLLHKVDIFKFMLSNTSGSDIARVLWLKSRSSEMWLDRRTTYARSLASSSMAGYLLGLGDRHPSNLMIDRASGKIMHIDFGDCFEVAMVRDKYPEKVPFRLTRMLVKALEPCGVEGYFRHTCEAVMRELREANNRESLLSMMEAFVHDPLLRMKLVGGEELQRLREEGNHLTAVNVMLYNSAPPILSESLQLRLLTQAGSLTAAHAAHSRQEQALVSIDLPVAGAIATGVNPHVPTSSTDSSFAKSPSTQSRRERDRLLKVVPTAKCIEVADERAAIALQRVSDKLYGQDFGDRRESLTVEKQVDLLINEAKNVENLCSLFTGWCPFW